MFPNLVAESVLSLQPVRGARHRRSLGAILWRGVLVGILASVLPVLVLRWVPPVTSSFMVQRQVRAWRQGESEAVHYRWVGWDRIPAAVRLAVVAGEDQKFPEHRGFDIASIRDALAHNARRARPRGASTITQQVAKNLFLWSGPSWVRKGLEAYLTVWIELLWPKRRVLEVYLNIAEFGDRVYGVGAAAETFFERPPERLTRRQAAMLAAVLPSPRRFHAERPTPYVAHRADWIERQMAHLGEDYLEPLDPSPARP